MFAQTVEPNVLLQWLQIIWLDLLLAGDNAIVIAMAVHSLPPRERRLGRLWCTAGAAILRVVFLAIASWLLAIPLLKAFGGIALIFIAWRLLAPKPVGPNDAQDKQRAGANLRDAIKIIVIADLSMSIDNVFAVTGAARGDLKMAAMGIAISIPIVIWGSGFLSTLMHRQPWIIWLGGGVLGYVAGSLLLEDEKVIEWFGCDPQHPGHPLPLALAIGFTVFGFWHHYRRRPQKPAANS